MVRSMDETEETGNLQASREKILPEIFVIVNVILGFPDLHNPKCALSSFTGFKPSNSSGEGI